MSPRPGRPAATEGGFAMVAVLLVLALIGLLGAEFAYSMRLEARAARNYKETLAASHLAEAGLENAIREIVGQGTIAAEAEDGLLTFYTIAAASGATPTGTPTGTPTRAAAIKRLPRENVPFGEGHYSYRITDEASRLWVNTAQVVRLNRLLQILGLEKEERDVIVDSIQDWRDDNDSHRVNGAESEDYYLKLPVPYRARNANLESIAELLQIRGITPALFHGTAERPGLVDLLTVVGRGEININTASKPVLQALGFSDAEIIEIQNTRREVPFTTMGRFSGRGLTANSRTYRIESVGILDGKPRARLTAIVEVGNDPTNAALRIVSWSGIR
jgi:general secretion pathway protein K